MVVSLPTIWSTLWGGDRPRPDGWQKNYHFLSDALVYTMELRTCSCYSHCKTLLALTLESCPVSCLDCVVSLPTVC